MRNPVFLQIRPLGFVPQPNLQKICLILTSKSILGDRTVGAGSPEFIPPTDNLYKPAPSPL
jgi:hypothetical protein